MPESSDISCALNTFEQQALRPMKHAWVGFQKQKMLSLSLTSAKEISSFPLTGGNSSSICEHGDAHERGQAEVKISSLRSFEG